MEHKDFLCEYCERICKNAMSLSQHRLRCEKNPGNRKAEMPTPSRKGKYVGETASDLTLKRKRNKERRTNDLFACEHCGQERDSFLGLRIHETRCSSNLSCKPKIISEETKKKISAANTGRKMSDEFRLKVSEAMKRAVLKNPESYTSSNRGRVKQIIVDGVKLHGSWEVIFYNWANENHLGPERCLRSFEYFWNGKVRNYFPDFYLPCFDLYVEVKGYETEQDREKWRQFPERIIVLKRPEIYRIKNNLPNLVEQLGFEPRTNGL